jgi:hypothetical protein
VAGAGCRRCGTINPPAAQAAKARLPGRRSLGQCGVREGCSSQKGSSVPPAAEEAQQRWVKIVCPPGSAWCKPQTPRAGRHGNGGLAALSDFDKPRCREASRSAGPPGPWRPARPRYFFGAADMEVGLPGAAKNAGDDACALSYPSPLAGRVAASEASGRVGNVGEICERNPTPGAARRTLPFQGRDKNVRGRAGISYSCETGGSRSSAQLSLGFGYRSSSRCTRATCSASSSTSSAANVLTFGSFAVSTIEVK